MTVEPSSQTSTAFKGLKRSFIFSELEHRLDFQLKESKVLHSYLKVLTAHTSYWTNMDVALFLHSQIYTKQTNHKL